MFMVGLNTLLSPASHTQRFYHKTGLTPAALATAKTQMVTKTFLYHCDLRYCVTFNHEHTSLRSLQGFILLDIPLVTALTSQVKTRSQEWLFMEGLRAMWEEIGNRDIFIHLTSTRGQ